MTPNLSFALLLVSLILYSGREATGRPSWGRAGLAALAAAWAALTAAIVVRWSQAGYAPLSNQYESLVFLAWSFLGLYLLFGRELPVRAPGLWATLATLVVLGLGSLLDKSVRPLVPALQSNWLLLHVSVCMIAYAAFFLSFLAAAWALAGRDWPSRALELSAEEFSYQTVSLGFLLLTLGIVFGSVWANEAWGTYWSWDPKETWSLITWLVYAVALHLRQAQGWRGRRFAAASAAGFACVVFTYFGVNYLLTGLHAYA